MVDLQELNDYPKRKLSLVTFCFLNSTSVSKEPNKCIINRSCLSHIYHLIRWCDGTKKPESGGMGKWCGEFLIEQKT